MGIFSKFVRYREQGEQTNIVNEQRFGTPAKSLFIATKFFSLTQRTEVTDEQGNVVYRVRSKAVSIHDKTYIEDADGNDVATIERKVLTLREYHWVTMADGTKFDIVGELAHIVKDVVNIEALGWVMRGNIAELNFQLYDADGSIIAVIGQKLVSVKDKYAIDIYRPELEDKIVAVLITLQHTIRTRNGMRGSLFMNMGRG